MSAPRSAGVARAARAVAAVALLAVVLLFGGSARPSYAAIGESIVSYDTTMDVQENGRLKVTEKIVYDFGIFTSEEKHGIFRKIPVRFRYNDHKNRVYPIDHVSVQRHGAREDVDQSSEGDYEVFKIGNKDRKVDGKQTYTINYEVRGALNSFPDHEELYWNAVGTEWDVAIDTATAVVRGPVAIKKVDCFAGEQGSNLSCAAKKAEDDSATFSQPDLGYGKALSVVVAFPKGSVRNTTPILEDRHDLAAAFRVTPTTVGGAAALAGVGGVGALVIAWLFGRDRRYVGQIPGLAPMPGDTSTESRKPMFGGPPIAVEFTPPDKVRPGQVGTLIDEQANTLDVTATIIDFAVRKHLLIKELPREGRWASQDWELTKLTDGDPEFLPYERKLFDALFKGRDTVKLSDLKYTFASDLGSVQQKLYRDMVEQGWYRRSPEDTRLWARRLGMLAVAAAGGVTYLLAQFTQFALVGVGLVVGALVLLAVSSRMPARTGKGSAALTRMLGFKLYLTTAEAEQIKFEEREQIFSRYLPYAMVFGVADRWAGEFRELGAVQPDGSSGLYWYNGQPGWNMLYFNHSIGSFSTTTTGTIASTPPSASGSSGFGGGGFSGGGGGGGGGGSW